VLRVLAEGEEIVNSFRIKDEVREWGTISVSSTCLKTLVSFQSSA